MFAVSPRALSRPLGSARNRHARGFTLLEMLAVIVLIGIAAVAVSVSVKQGLASARISAASAELAAALRATRARAIMQGQEQNFDVDVANNSYRGAEQREMSLPKGMHLGIVSAKEYWPNPHTGSIHFFPDGSSTGGHVTLQSGARQWQVNVEWLTGAIAVASGDSR